jgi:hypothetical protein
MSACEKCWRDANQRALLLGGSVSDHYRDLLNERRDNQCESATSVDAGATKGEGSQGESAQGLSSLLLPGSPR